MTLHTAHIREQVAENPCSTGMNHKKHKWQTANTHLNTHLL